VRHRDTPCRRTGSADSLAGPWRPREPSTPSSEALRPLPSTDQRSSHRLAPDTVGSSSTIAVMGTSFMWRRPDGSQGLSRGPGVQHGPFVPPSLGLRHSWRHVRTLLVDDDKPDPGEISSAPGTTPATVKGINDGSGSAKDHHKTHASLVVAPNPPLVQPIQYSVSAPGHVESLSTICRGERRNPVNGVRAGPTSPGLEDWREGVSRRCLSRRAWKRERSLYHPIAVVP
jgi:hypothetical protein